jgi:hypothetical protein
MGESSLVLTLTGVGIGTVLGVFLYWISSRRKS